MAGGPERKVMGETAPDDAWLALVPEEALVSPNVPLSAMAPHPATNSVSPSDRSSSGPSRRYIERHSAYTVATTL